MADATQITLASRPQGKPSTDNFKLQTATLPAVRDGQILVRVIWLSLDPYMRGRMDDAKSYAKPVEIGEVMEGGAVAEVMESRNADFKPGQIVVGAFGWTSHAISNGEGVRVVDPEQAPISTALGVLGMPGITAWVGLNDIGRAKDGETIVVSAATGAVGAVVGQLAKARNMRVIGVAGGPEKCAFAVEELGYDVCLDHYAHDAKSLSAAIKDAAPDGVDVYFESVGGKTLEAVLTRMNTHGRIALCGMIAWYSGNGVAEAQPLPAVWRNILTRRLLVEGFIIFDHYHKFPDFVGQVAPMVADGTVKFREDVAEGLENAPQAFLDMLSGGNFGKQLVRVGADPA
ncbi:NADP-dependent oxidoreductase [Loktanella sp. 3ANDIMAR09]|uniref:NADP-dependent oxidoreductase n=1 Tax=Loktanella sp. 3ANDIMAR09 TaxID=1225657 RepID=UPI0006FAE212|nr:NADP-dependent oxidoreductase [Loktanella sp. 3ANDIMAR09]KQI70206.1 NADP-dependent oxidoreductase [Loktanella sp. 3ANDIMAR09]